MDLYKAWVLQCSLCKSGGWPARSTGHPGRIMVRARLRAHLESLKSRFPDLLGECQIEESAGTDYKYRIFLAKSIWTAVLQELGEETNYDNFKSAVARHQGRDGIDYEDSLHDVWSVMYKLQK